MKNIESESMDNFLISYEKQIKETPTLKQMLRSFFIRPNEEKFRLHFLENSFICNLVKYEECTLDFVPITNMEYFIIDNENEQILGTYTVKPYHESDCCEKTFKSVLIADIWDIREVMSIIQKKSWEHIYFVLNQTVRKFASFFKLEGFIKTLPPNIKFFLTTEEMQQYFLMNRDVYLPSTVISPEPERYEHLIEKIHEYRVQNGVPSNHILLSICIPSYDRGRRAWKAVQHALTIPYDAEIEIVLVNNGSTIGVESYEKIKSIKDSRLKYCEFEKNAGFAINYCNCLKQASGRFALILSDEDPIAVENIEQILEYLYSNFELGACTFDGISGIDDGNARPRESKVFMAGAPAINWAIDWIRYFSGTCYNVDHIKSSHIFEKMEKYKSNLFNYYPQCVLGILLGTEFDTSNSGIKGWYYGEVEEGGGNIEEVVRSDKLLSYALPECRLKEEYDTMRLLKDFLSGDDFEAIFLKRVLCTFDIISAYYNICGDKLTTMYCWFDIWMEHYKNCLRILREMEEKFVDAPSVILKMNKTFLNWQICKREQRWHTPEENLLPSLQAQIAKYYYEKGKPIEEINFVEIENISRNWVKEFLEKGVDLLS